MWELKENVYPRAPAPEEEKGLLTQPFLFIDILQNASYVSIKTNQLIDSLSLTNKDNGYVISIKSDDAKEPINFIALNKANFITKRMLKGSSKAFSFEVCDTNSKTKIEFKKKRDSCFCCSRRKMFVTIDGKQIGYVVYISSFFYDEFYLYQNECVVDKKEFKYYIKISKYQWSYLMRNTILCNNIDLSIPIMNKDNKNVGLINKMNPNKISKLFKGWSNVDYFNLSLPKEANVNDKLVILGASLMIDNLFIEDIYSFIE